MQYAATPALPEPSIIGIGHPDFAWGLTWGVLALDLAWMLLGGWSVSIPGIAVIAGAVLVFQAPLAFARYRNDVRIATTARAATLLIVFMGAAGTLSYLVVSTGAPLVDPSLAAADRALGFDWLALQRRLQEHADAGRLLELAYASALPQILFVILFLGFTARTEQLENFMSLFVLATLLTILLSGPFPAAGAWKWFAPAGGAIDPAPLDHFEALRDGRLRHIPLRDMQGLISIPSLHAALAVLLVHGMRRTALFAVFVVIDAAVLVSTPVSGGHYLVDVIAGCLLALALIASAEPERAAWRPAQASAPGRAGALTPERTARKEAR
jgi:hypothetical protein